MQWTSLKGSLLLGVFLCLGTLLAFAPGVCDCTLASLEWVDGIGPWGPVALLAIYVVATLVMIPGTLLTLGAGAIFGLWTGTLTVVIGSNFGALAAFPLGRSLFCGWARSIVKKNNHLSVLDRAIAQNGFRIVFLTRLSPIFPFNLLNYAFGVTRVSTKDYVVASVLGMLPGTFLYVYLGTSAGNLLALRNSSESDSLSMMQFAIGLLITLVLTVYLHRLAQNQLERDRLSCLIEEPTSDSDSTSTTELHFHQGD